MTTSIRSRVVSLLQAFKGNPEKILLSRDDAAALERELQLPLGDLPSKVPSIDGIQIVDYAADETEIV